MSRPALRRALPACLLAVPVALPVPGLAATDCPPAAPGVLLERFIPADCGSCWSATPPNPAPGRDAALLDWIVPAPPGVDAPMAVAALMEAAPRAARGGRLASDETLTQSHPLPARSALAIEVQDGPALNGYIALQMRVRFTSQRPLPSGLSAWMALIERLPAGTEGSPVQRQLVRSVVGPLPLEGLASRRPIDHLRAVRVPETGAPERLSSLAWVETDRGRVIAIGQAATAACPR